MYYRTSAEGICRCVGLLVLVGISCFSCATAKRSSDPIYGFDSDQDDIVKAVGAYVLIFTLPRSDANVDFQDRSWLASLFADAPAVIDAMLNELIASDVIAGVKDDRESLISLLRIGDTAGLVGDINYMSLEILYPECQTIRHSRSTSTSFPRPHGCSGGGGDREQRSGRHASRFAVESRTSASIKQPEAWVHVDFTLGTGGLVHRSGRLRVCQLLKASRVLHLVKAPDWRIVSDRVERGSGGR